MFKKIIFTLHHCEKITADSKKKTEKTAAFFSFFRIVFQFFSAIFKNNGEKHAISFI